MSEKRKEERKVFLEFSRELPFFLSVHLVPALCSKVVNPCCDHGFGRFY